METMIIGSNGETMIIGEYNVETIINGEYCGDNDHWGVMWRQ